MKNKLSYLFAALIGFSGNSCQSNHSPEQNVSKTDSMNINHANTDTAVLAGGCFWCLDAVYRRMEGVIDVESGYSNGAIPNPSYEDVCSGTTGYAEVVSIAFDTTKTSYSEILEVFWRVHNPTTINRQGSDVGTQYRSGIFYRNEQQRDIALKSKEAVEQSHLWDGKIVTQIEPLKNYFAAEEYHQNYYANNPNNPYCTYVVGEKVAKFKKLFAEKLKKSAENQP